MKLEKVLLLFKKKLQLKKINFIIKIVNINIVIEFKKNC